jgi:hypothetical protein
MKLINLFGFYTVGMQVHPLGQLEATEGKTLRSIFLEAVAASAILRQLLDSEEIPLFLSKDAAIKLLKIIDEELIPNKAKSFEEFSEQLKKPFTAQDATKLKDGVRDFETVLATELPRLDIYAVTKKGIYSTPDLIEHADMALSADVRKTVSDEAKRDLKQAGKCLAFELATASGYHAMRATERVLREYYTLVVKKPGQNARMKQCVDELRNHGADARVMAVLDQIRDLHRNPIDHPEIFMKMTEAIELFDIAKSAISAMARQMTKLSAEAKPLPPSPSVP